MCPFYKIDISKTSIISISSRETLSRKWLVAAFGHDVALVLQFLSKSFSIVFSKVKPFDAVSKKQY